MIEVEEPGDSDLLTVLSNAAIPHYLEQSERLGSADLVILVRTGNGPTATYVMLREVFMKYLEDKAEIDPEYVDFCRDSITSPANEVTRTERAFWLVVSEPSVQHCAAVGVQPALNLSLNRSREVAKA